MYEPRRLTEDDTLFFMHMHKNAGTSFRMLLLDHFPNSVLWRDQWVSIRERALALSCEEHLEMTKLSQLPGRFTPADAPLMSP